ncbi:uncharacterized protein EAE97_005547 [Botrytis byssoidea]|uniref:Uncharacterized protein n=1 Tax=Botrytis byssoidea TaxID=139641 RepID=A0A9P5IKQ3_9HELO|nr:uncharacterized protein EAE97_005547 [Botrytis byssoidea]KAF7944914.1 hypothetical protein EAE97_005547 [Botrytis byssoidea]
MNSNTTTESSHIDRDLVGCMPPRLSTILSDDLERKTSPPREGRADRLVIFHFMRHGQAYSNIGELGTRSQLRDPKLTFDGIRQCELVRTVLNSNRNIKQIYCSPMIRTIQTALTTFRDVMEFSMEKPATKIEAWDELREWGSIPCCTGTPVAKLQKRFGQQIDFGLIKPGWEVNREIYGDISRADKVKESLFKIARNVQELTRRGLIYDVRDGDSSTRGPYYVPYEIAIVSHGGFLETMLEAELGGRASVFPFRNCFHNANLKSFLFETIDGLGGVRHELTETKESRTRKYSRSSIPLG